MTATRTDSLTSHRSPVFCHRRQTSPQNCETGVSDRCPSESENLIAVRVTSGSLPRLRKLIRDSPRSRCDGATFGPLVLTLSLEQVLRFFQDHGWDVVG